MADLVVIAEVQPKRMRKAYTATGIARTVSGPPMELDESSTALAACAPRPSDLFGLRAFFTAVADDGLQYLTAAAHAAPGWRIPDGKQLAADHLQRRRVPRPAGYGGQGDALAADLTRIWRKTCPCFGG